MNDIIIKIDGLKCSTVEQFFLEISEKMHFPDYFTNNLDSFSECINDLSWLESDNYFIVIENSSEFLCKENNLTKEKLFETLSNTIKEWANVPNYAGEEEFRKKSIFKIDYI